MEHLKILKIYLVCQRTVHRNWFGTEKLCTKQTLQEHQGFQVDVSVFSNKKK